MASHNGSASYLPADDSKPSWSWLQNRIVQKAETRGFSEWIDVQLNVLEADYEDLVTVDSLDAAERGHSSRRRRSGESQ